MFDRLIPVFFPLLKEHLPINLQALSLVDLTCLKKKYQLNIEHKKKDIDFWSPVARPLCAAAFFISAVNLFKHSAQARIVIALYGITLMETVEIAKREHISLCNDLCLIDQAIIEKMNVMKPALPNHRPTSAA